MSDLLLTACRLTCVHMCMWFWDETGLRVFLGTENWLFLATALWVAFMVCGISHGTRPLHLCLCGCASQLIAVHTVVLVLKFSEIVSSKKKHRVGYRWSVGKRLKA
ncbi:hypothetical protein BDV97DRAFT_354162 [Delphinella strobiligena]|nr:hypothetical protein BDV97DRAFT_354162 [Delphinella strobiligena]